MDSKYGRSTLAKVELDIPPLKEIKDQLQVLADHFKQAAQDVDIMIVTLEKRVAVLREENRLDKEGRQEREEDKAPSQPFRGASQYPSSAKEPPSNPTPTPAPCSQEYSRSAAQESAQKNQPLDQTVTKNPQELTVNQMEHSSGNDPTTEEESTRNKR